MPEFGGWNESDPSAGDGFTDIFNKVREEKNNESKEVLYITDDSMYSSSYSHGSSKKSPVSGLLIPEISTVKIVEKY